MVDLIVSKLGSSVILMGFLGSVVSGLATSLGVFPIFFIRKISDKAQDIMMGFGAGIMLAAVSFSLVVPGIHWANQIYGNKMIAALLVAAGMMLGGLFLFVSDKLIPHDLFHGIHHGGDSKALKRLWLFVLAITLHNFPEGLSVGVGFGGGDVANGIPLMVGIGIQNMPEGLVVALGLLANGYRKGKAFWVATLTGLVEPIGGLIGASLVSLSSKLLPWGLAFAAGAMLFVISDEIIPESHRKGFEKQATFGVMAGFVLMMVLDVALG